MNSSDQGDPASRTGAHRAHRRTPRAGVPRPEETAATAALHRTAGPAGPAAPADPAGAHTADPDPPPSPHEPYLDGLFTYCLSVLCDHDAATDALGDVLAVADRHPGRCPHEGDRRAWLYALARWACLRRLAEERRARLGAHSARRAPGHTDPGHAPQAHRPLDATAQGTADASAHGIVVVSAPAASRTTAPVSAQGAAPAASPSHGTAPASAPASAVATAHATAQRRTELARLAWPEAAGTTPEQREALELAVRHRLGVAELAAVLGTAPAAVRELLSAAACEVERTRAALAVVETANCPAVSRLTGEDGDRDVLLSSTLRAELVRHVDDCPRCRRVAERVGAAAPWPGSGGLHATLPLVPAPRGAVRAAMLHSGRRRGGRPGPRFDRTGFPMDPKDRAARRDRLRSRAVTTTVVATVVAAPVIALWAAYRGAPTIAEPVGDGTRISVGEAQLPPPLAEGPPLTAYENTGNTARTTGEPGFASGPAGPDVSVEVISSGAPATPEADGPGAPGRLTVAAAGTGGTTLLTLSASGGSPVHWRLWSDAPWLRASQTAGTLAPGETVTLRITVDTEAQPVGAWTARVGVDPGGAVVSVSGRGRPAPATDPTPPAPDPTPTPTPTPTPAPTPTPTPTPAEPTDPAPSSGPGGTVSPAPAPPAP
ncbi:RNA polymerase sigma factor [Streptomyces sp. NPDC001389]|uniref:RNA polymerase sigma factor n=1 Tax=unclassified Streptomyces TaxID=2593676 RepID=UPI00369588EF